MIDAIMEDVLPHALAIGVDYDLFWTLTPNELIPFHKAFSISRDIDDINNWQLGHYMRLAIGSWFNESNKYPNRPMFTEPTEKELDDEKKYQQNKENNLLIRHKILQRAKYINPILEKRKKLKGGGDTCLEN